MISCIFAHYLQLLDACKEVDPAVLDIETQIIAEKAWGKIVDGQLAQLIQQTRQEVTSSVSIGDSSEEIVSNFLDPNKIFSIHCDDLRTIFVPQYTSLSLEKILREAQKYD